MNRRSFLWAAASGTLGVFIGGLPRAIGTELETGGPLPISARDMSRRAWAVDKAARCADVTIQCATDVLQSFADGRSDLHRFTIALSSKARLDTIRAEMPPWIKPRPFLVLKPLAEKRA